MLRAIASLLLAAALVAQTAPTLPDLGPAAAVPQGAPPHLARIDREGLRTHVVWLADDARSGRHTGSTGQQDTARYVADQFKALGLKPLGDKKGFLQHYPLQRTWLDAASGVRCGDLVLDRDLAVLAGGPGKWSISGRFVHCGNGSPAAVPGGLAGRIPLVVLHGTGGGGGAGNDLRAVQRYQQIAEQLAARGATAGVVCLLDDAGALGNTLNYRGLLPDHAQLRYGDSGRGLDVAVPLLVLSAAQSRRLFAPLGLALGPDGAPAAALGDDKATGKLVITVHRDDKGSGSNVVAVLEGTSRKSEAVVVSAHHDHVGRRLDGDVFNGADDNASGTAGLLELAEAFARGGARPERSIVFLSVSGEELGLWGSDWFATHPTWPLAKIVANVNIDMIGRAGGGEGEPTRMQVTPSHRHEQYSTLVREAVVLGDRLGIAFTSGDTYYERSDHFNFARRGVPVVFFCDGEHPDYHQVTDTADRLDYGRMEAVSRLAFWITWQTAHGKDRPAPLGARDSW